MMNGLSSQKLKKADGTIAYVWDNKLHNWEGPALIPEGNTEKKLNITYMAFSIVKAES